MTSTSNITQLDLTGYPPAVVAWLYTTVDTICEPLGCGEWREAMPASWTQAWLSPKYRMTQSITSLLPSLLTYEEFRQGADPNLQNLYQFAMETPSTTLADLTSSSSMCVLIVLVLLLRLIKKILLPFFSSIGRKTGRQTHGPSWEAANETRIIKFGEYVFRLFFHSGISLAGIYYFWDKEWWKKGGTVTLFQEFPHQDIAPGMIWYYLVQSAYNIDAMISLLELSFSIERQKNGFPTIVWAKECRGDFREMFVHHVVTNLLIIGSSFFRFTRVGSMVFLVHDISDVPVDLSKLANFLKWKATTAICFISMVVVWLMTRLGALPFTIYASVLNESYLVCESGIIDPIYYIYYKPFFVVLIGLLILLHLAWFTMFIQMGWVLISKGETHDLSEHKSGEHQPISKKKV